MSYTYNLLHAHLLTCPTSPNSPPAPGHQVWRQITTSHQRKQLQALRPPGDQGPGDHGSFNKHSQVGFWPWTIIYSYPSIHPSIHPSICIYIYIYYILYIIYYILYIVYYISYIIYYIYIYYILYTIYYILYIIHHILYIIYYISYYIYIHNSRYRYRYRWYRYNWDLKFGGTWGWLWAIFLPNSLWSDTALENPPWM